jgi:hypothetical protein
MAPQDGFLQSQFLIPLEGAVNIVGADDNRVGDKWWREVAAMIENGAVTMAGAGGGSSNDLAEGRPLAPSKIIYNLFFFVSKHCIGIKFALN